MNKSIRICSSSMKEIHWTTDPWTTSVWTVQAHLRMDFSLCIQYSTVSIFSLSCGFLNSISFSLAYFILRIQYIIHIICQISVNQLFMLSIMILVKWAIQFCRIQKLYMDFWLWRGSAPLPPALVRGQLYLQGDQRLDFTHIRYLYSFT